MFVYRHRRTKPSYRELLLITGLSQHGIGNWKKIAEHLGTRTKEEVAEHYHSVYINSPDWPVPVRATKPYPLL